MKTQWLRHVLNLALFSYLFLQSPYDAQATLPLDLTEVKGVHGLGPHLELLEDPGGNLSFEDIAASKTRRSFLPVTGQTLNFGFSQSAYWMRFVLINRLEKEKSYLLEAAFPLIDHVTLIVKGGNGNYTVRESGELVPISEREVKYRNPVFPLVVGPGEETVCYLRLQDNGSVPFTLKLWEPPFFTRKIMRERAIYGFYYGGMIIIAAYNLIIYLMVRIKTFIFYVFYVASFILWQTAYNGFANEFLWPAQPWLTNQAIPFLICLTCFFALWFTKTFLETPANIPMLDRFMTLLMVGFGTVMVVALQPNYAVSVLFSTFLALLLVPTVLAAGFTLWKKGYRPARYFCIAWFVLLIGTGLLALKSFGFLPSTFITEYGQQVGSFVEIMLLSLALSDQVNVIKLEKETAQRDALYFQKLATQKLEDEVRLRTAALRASNRKLENLSSRLAKYLSPQLYISIFSGKTEVRLQSYRKKLTIFFSDIKDFTRLTDTLEPETLTSIINTYLDEMAAIALRHGGTIDKYIGDAIMIFFGDPETRGEKEDALACVKMAIEMREHMKKVHKENLIPSGTPPLQIRMGINSGYCTVGNFGSEERLDYTIIGGPVNLASRLESQAEPNEILISRSTYALIKDEIASEERGEITVKGIARPVQIYQVVDLWKNFKKGPEQVHLQGHGFSFQMNLDALSGESKVKAYSCLEHLKTRLDEKPKN